MSKSLRIALPGLLLCLLTPCIWYLGYQRRYCLVPPSGPNAEIVVSACQSPRLVSVSPDGRYISYYARGWYESQSWLLDTLTDERRPDPCWGEWWLSGTMRLGGYVGDANRHGEFWICDLSDGTKVQPQWVEDLPGMVTQAADYNETYSPQVAEWFRNAKQVYYVAFQRWAIALSPDFKAHPEHIYVLTNRLNYPRDSVLRFLQNNQIPYVRIGHAGDGTPLISHNGRFLIPSSGPSGLYAADGKRIGPLYEYVQSQWCCYAYGWASDDSGVYAQGDVNSNADLFALPPPAQPILKLDLPAAYLTPTALRAMHGRQNSQQRAVLFRVAVPLVLLAGGSWYFGRRKRASQTAPGT